MSDALITSLTLEQLREVMQLAGYRVEAMTDPVANGEYLRSATSGIAFDVRPGNRLAASEGSFVDVAMVAVLQVHGELPLDIVNRWNASRRFARLQLSPPFLILTHDVSVAGGVAQNHLRAQIEIWDHLVQQLVGYLREELPKLGGADRTATPAASVERGIQPSASATVQ
jgi:Putative bacterial sensory transduction regulator